MANLAKKMAVLTALKAQSEPVSLLSLLEVLGPGYNPRTLRRYLAEMVKEGLLSKIGHKRATKYQAASPSSKQGGYFSLKSQKAIEKIRKPLYDRNPVSYSLDWLNKYEPNMTFYIPKEVREGLYQAGFRSEGREPAGTYAHQIFNRLLIDLSYNSSRLEGNTYSLLETQKLLLEGATPEGKFDEEKIMILNHKEAIRYLVDNASKILVEPETILTLHYLLSDGLVESVDSGKVRRHAVRVGGSTYIPLEDPEEISKELVRITQKAALIKDPHEQSLFLLIHVSYLQAFCDVNKRAARLASNIPLIKNNLVPLSFSDIEQGDYISALIAIYELQDIAPIVDLYAFSYLRTCMMYDATAASMGFDEIRVRYRAKRRAIVRDIIIKNLHGKDLEQFIAAIPLGDVQDVHKERFIKNILDDLKGLDVAHIAGLGITKEELSMFLAQALVFGQFH